jgi:mono/diheme cytochrome c family protein
MRICVATLLVSAAATGVLCSQPTTIKNVPITYTQPDDGKAMFSAYCAVCHGPDGRGGGPAADALKKSPTDLTQLAIRNNGTFPYQNVMNVLSFGPAEMISHGSKDMPIWGKVFRSMGSAGDSVSRIRVSALTDYLKSIQRK